MKIDKEEYVKKILELYVRLPETPNRFSRFDRRLAEQLYKEELSIEQVEAAFFLASVRRLARCESEPFGPIRSLHYFVPVLNELKLHPLPPDYIRYLRRRLTVIK